MRASDGGEERPYESADGICSKCNCTITNVTLVDGENGKLFSLDCSMKSFKQLFAKWPEEMGDNHTGISNLIRNNFYKSFPILRHGNRLHHVT